MINKNLKLSSYKNAKKNMYSSVSTMELNWCRIMYNESTYIIDNYLEHSKVMKWLYLPINNYKEILYNEPISCVTNWTIGIFK